MHVRSSKSSGAMRLVADAMIGDRRSILLTDAYKFSMGQAGFPLREESFYLSFRNEGAQFIPFDIPELVDNLVSRIVKEPDHAEADFLGRHGYRPTSEMLSALGLQAPAVMSLPENSWVYAREPVLTITGPSFAVSLLEAVLIWIHFPMQVATAIKKGARHFDVSTRSEAEIVSIISGLMGARVIASIQESGYRASVRAAMRSLVGAAGGRDNASRILEVGMRSANTLETHEAALEACREEGLTQTSNVLLAHKLNLVPVGTTGHEHQLRWRNDFEGYRAMRDLRKGVPCYLFDTYDPIKIGIPEIVRIMRQRPREEAVVRFDSGDKRLQFKMLRDAELKHTLSMKYVFMDLISDSFIAENDRYGESLGVPREKLIYGVGGFLIDRTAPHPLTRSNISAVCKLCRTGSYPVMKFSEGNKESIPGDAIVERVIPPAGKPFDIVRQLDEMPADTARKGFYPEADVFGEVPSRMEFSERTNRLILVLTADKDRQAMG